MSKILLIHPDLSSIGGAEKLALGMVEVLLKMGHDINILTLKLPINTSYIRSYFGFSSNLFNRIKFINPYRFSYLAKVLSNNRIPHLIKNYYFIPDIMEKIVSKIRDQFELIINTHAQKLYLTSDINYVHFPIVASFREKYLFENHIGKPKSVLKKSYYSLIKFLVLKGFYKVNEESIILANSRFTARYIYKYYGLYPKILYPYVDINQFLKVSGSHNRKNYVISIGRISPEKNYDVVPIIAKHAKNVRKFIIIGSTYSASYKIMYNVLKKATELNVKDKIVFVPNASFEKLLALLSCSKVFLHTMKYEHFGIAVVEAMASGLIPVVHRSGGPWTDIILEGKYGYGYSDPEEAAQVIDEIVNMYSKSMIKNIIERAKYFNKNRFVKIFSRILRESI